jgi:hypothetical protein
MAITWNLPLTTEEDVDEGDTEKHVLSPADLDKMDEDELHDFIKKRDLEINPDKYPEEENLREAVKEEMGLYRGEAEEGEDLFEDMNKGALDVSLGAYLWVPQEDQVAALSLYVQVLTGGSYRKRWRRVKKLCRKLKGEVHLHNPHWGEDKLEVKRYPLDETLEIANIAKELVLLAEKVEEATSWEVLAFLRHKKMKMITLI